MLGWSAGEPAGTVVSVRARSSNDRRIWSLWEDVRNHKPLLRTPSGRYLEVEATLQTFGMNVPILYDLTIQASPACGDFEHPYPVGDLTFDCKVDLLDLALLAENWLECTALQCP